MTQIFVNYSRPDRDDTTPLLEALRQHYGSGSVWADQSFRGGKDWWQEVRQHIADADVFVYLLTKDSIKTRYCLEAYREAWRLGRPVLAVQLDAHVKVPVGVEGLRAVDLSDEDPTRSAALQRLRDAIDQLAWQSKPAEPRWAQVMPAPKVPSPQDEALFAAQRPSLPQTLPVYDRSLVVSGLRPIILIVTILMSLGIGVFIVLVQLMQ